MSTEAAARSAALNPFEQLRHARQIIQSEAQTLLAVAGRLDPEFCRAVELILGCRGRVIVSGMGKAGLVGRKIMATLASTGTASHCLHPAEAVHGDLGRVGRDDLMLILSQSGETEEIVRLLPSLGAWDVPIIAVTARADSTLGRAARVVIELGPIEEACPLGLAPSASTTAMLAVGDALALVASRMRNFAREDFARFHPAGNLGRKLSKVEDHMRPLDQCRLADERQTVREVLIRAARPGRRTGATMLVDAEGRLSGVFTDSDLARLFEGRREDKLDRRVAEVMTRKPLAIPQGSRMTAAVELIAGRKISELPVVDGEGRPVGMIDITDVVGLLPSETSRAEAPEERSRPPWRIVDEPGSESAA